MEPRLLRILGIVLLALLVVGGLAIYLHPYFEERASLARLPPADRQSMFQRTLTDLQACAALGPLAPQVHCGDQASFILQLPECDDTCRSLARSIKQGATR